MNKNVEQAVGRYFTAIANRDAQAWASNFAPDGTSEDPVGGEPVAGRSALAAFQQSIFEAFPVMRLDADEIIVCGSQAAVRWSCHVENGTTGTDFTGINTYEVNDHGQILRQKAFWDIAAVQQALGDAQ
jgi:uncharacterized protein (TIGR02246 family)